MPRDWIVSQPNEHEAWDDGPIIYISDFELSVDCATRSGPPNPPDERGRACDWPIETLPPGGTLVTWWDERILGPLPTEGEPISANGRPTFLAREAPGRCADIGGDVTLITGVPTETSETSTNLGLFACLREPSTEIDERHVIDLIESSVVDW